MPVAMRVVDREGKWVYANEEAANLFQSLSGNWPDGLRINWKFLFTDGNPYAPGDHPSMRSIRNGEIVRSEEMILLRGDGSKVFISTNSAPIRDSEGRITAAVVTHFDITKRVRAEKDVARLLVELQKHSIELERARKSLETTINQMPVGVAIAESPSGKIIVGNAALENIFRRRSLPSGGIDEYQAWEIYHPDGAPLTNQEHPLARALIFGEDVKSEEIHIVRGDGTRGIVLASSAPVRNPQGIIDVAVMIMVDITEQKELEKVHGEQSEELARSNAELQQFAYIASHDLQEPLRMITGFLQLLEKRHKKELSLEAQEYIDYSVKGAKRMQELINDLLFYTRVGRQQGKMKPTDMNSALIRALENLSQTIKETNATITSWPPSDRAGRKDSDDADLPKSDRKRIEIPWRGTSGDQYRRRTRWVGMGLLHRGQRDRDRSSIPCEDLPDIPEVAFSGRLSRHGDGTSYRETNRRETQWEDMG